MKFRYACAALSLAASITSAKADVMAYAIDNAQNLYSVDLTTASASVIGPTNSFLEAIALAPNGTLYGTDPNGHLFSLNESTGQGTLIGGSNIGDVEGLMFAGNSLIGISADVGYYSYNTNTGAQTFIAPYTSSFITALAYISGNNAFAANARDQLLTVNYTTGSATIDGTLPNYFAAIGYTGSQLYGLDDVGSEWLINPSNANSTLVGSLGSQFWLDLAIIPSAARSVPEPITLSVFGAGLAGVLVKRRQKKST